MLFRGHQNEKVDYRIATPPHIEASMREPGAGISDAGGRPIFYDAEAIYSLIDFDAPSALKDWVFMGISGLFRTPLPGRAARRQTTSIPLARDMTQWRSKNDVGSARTIGLYLLSTHVPNRKELTPSNGATIRLSERPSAHESPRHSARQRLSDRATDRSHPLAPGRSRDWIGRADQVPLLQVARRLSHPPRSSARESDLDADSDRHRLRDTAGGPGMHR